MFEHHIDLFDEYLRVRLPGLDAMIPKPNFLARKRRHLLNLNALSIYKIFETLKNTPHYHNHVQYYFLSFPYA